tara:strand:+ start:1690 stop:1851 length:162 start_codon:yes stop_codon:yes gene_type:complete
MNKKIPLDKIPLTQLLPNEKENKEIQYKEYMDQHYSKESPWFFNYVKNLNVKK